MLLIKTWNRCWSAPHFIFLPNISWRFFVFGTVDLECIADVRLQVKNNGTFWSNFKIAAVQELYWDFSCSLAISKSNFFFPRSLVIAPHMPIKWARPKTQHALIFSYCLHTGYALIVLFQHSKHTWTDVCFCTSTRATWFIWFHLYIQSTNTSIPFPHFHHHHPVP